MLWHSQSVFFNVNDQNGQNDQINVKGIEGLAAQKVRIYEIYICMSCRSAHKTSQKIGFMSRSIRFGNASQTVVLWLTKGGQRFNNEEVRF